jgi:mannose/fructose/N-acetylgalactosamine-specific phosphotransferase system component IID
MAIVPDMPAGENTITARVSMMFEVKWATERSDNGEFSWVMCPVLGQIIHVSNLR